MRVCPNLLFLVTFSLNPSTDALIAVPVRAWHQVIHPNLAKVSALSASAGDEVDTEDFGSYSYESGLRALQVYYKHHGDLVITRSFEVPADKGRYVSSVGLLISYFHLNRILPRTEPHHVRVYAC